MATCCCSTNPPTIWTSKRYAHSKKVAGYPGCAVVISHDRWFLDRIATHILAYEGDSQWFWFEGNFESYEKNKIERLGLRRATPPGDVPQAHPRLIRSRPVLKLPPLPREGRLGA